MQPHRIVFMQQLVLDIGLPCGPTLDNYFVGTNGAAWQHLRMQVQAGRQTRSPVPTYLWGEEASGKTHLLRAVREAIVSAGADAACVGWLDASVTQPPPFGEDWEVVLMDDVHLYTAAQQQVAFNWFVNAVAPAQGLPRWVLAAGQVPPADLKLREDLRTRLGWGPVFQLALLQDEERRCVLAQAAQARGLHLADEVLDFMLKRFSRDLGSLMQLLDHLDGFALQTRRAITIPLIRAMLETQ
jgi:DnaA family protein